MDVLKRARQVESRVREWRCHIHAHPELGMETEATASFVEKILGEIGVTDIRRCGGTGVTALVRGAGTQGSEGCVGLRADMDALPVDERNDLPYKSVNAGVAHVCGHDLHTACLLGAAQVLHDLRAEFQGTVKLIFQPGEEGAGGAAAMIADGALENPKMNSIFALHSWPDLPVGAVGFRRGSVLASAQAFEVRLKGKQGHAAHPHRCIDPILIAGHVICALQSIVAREIGPLETGVLTLGKIAGGAAGNIIPEEVVIEGTIRALSSDVNKRIIQAVTRIVEGTATMLRGSASFKFSPGLPPVVNDDALFDRMETLFRKNFGDQRARLLPEPSMGAEDFALFLERVPGAHFRLGVGREGQNNFPLHSPDFIADDGGVPYGVAGLALLALDSLGLKNL
ncbi:MAG: amidohydrolase [Synergistaceae bacterium]|jgi:amidohydrolase|nr:amidohydrolase [Synergistaceae bacterium]